MSKDVSTAHWLPGPQAMAVLAHLIVAGAVLLGVLAPVAAQPPAALVRVDAVREEPLSQTVPVIGRIVPRQAGNVAARVAGPVTEFKVEVGDRVTADQIIVVLDREILEVNRDVANGRLVEARARLETKRARVDLAKLDRERLERLKASQSAARSSFDDARQQEIIARAEVKEAQAVVSAAVADLRRAEINLDRAEIHAPYAGVITQRFIEAGDYVTVGKSVVRMVADQALEVEADVPFERIAGLTAGAEVSISLDDGISYTAEVRAVLPEENRLTRTRTVRLVPNFDGALGPLASGQSVTVLVPLGAPRNVLSVHKDAVTRKGTDTLVYVVDEGVAKLRPVTLGEGVGNRFEVLGGLRRGEQVVVRGNERLRPNDKVQLDEAPS